MFVPFLLVTGCQSTTPTDGVDPTDSGTTTPVASVRDPKFDAVVAKLEAELDANYAEGVSIAVMEGGAYTWIEGFGITEPSTDAPVAPDTIFQIGSTTKQMTAANFLQALGPSLDATVAELLPAFSLTSDPGWAEDATLRDLLSHQGGLVDSLDWSASSDDDQLAAWHYEVYAPNLWANNPAGALWNYSNPNFTVAGLAVETHDPDGRYWPDIMEEDLFGPLGMTSTFARKGPVASSGRYSQSWGVTPSNYSALQFVSMDDIVDPASIRPAGLVWSTPSDMCRWGSFLLHGDPGVLADDLRAEITTAQTHTIDYIEFPGYPVGYGLGEFVWDEYPLSDGVYPLRVWTHGGNTLSFTSALVILPDQDVVISILSNGAGDDWHDTTEAILRAVVTPFPDPVPGAGLVVDPTDLDSHVGHYLDPHNVGEVDITAGGEHGLQISMPLLDQYGYSVATDLVPLTTDLWYVIVDGVPYDLTFIRDAGDAGDPWVRDRAFVLGRADATSARLAPPGRAAVAAALERARTRGQ